MSRKIISCEDCGAEFTVRHTMSERHYEIRHCVFCGAEIPEYNEDDYDNHIGDKIYISTNVSKKKISGKESFVVKLNNFPNEAERVD